VAGVIIALFARGGVYLSMCKRLGCPVRASIGAKNNMKVSIPQPSRLDIPGKAIWTSFHRIVRFSVLGAAMAIDEAASGNAKHCESPRNGAGS